MKRFRIILAVVVLIAALPLTGQAKFSSCSRTGSVQDHDPSPIGGGGSGGGGGC